MPDTEPVCTICGDPWCEGCDNEKPGLCEWCGAESLASPCRDCNAALLDTIGKRERERTWGKYYCVSSVHSECAASSSRGGLREPTKFVGLLARGCPRRQPRSGGARIPLPPDETRAGANHAHRRAGTSA